MDFADFVDGALCLVTARHPDGGRGAVRAAAAAADGCPVVVASLLTEELLAECKKHNVGQWVAPTTADQVKDLLVRIDYILPDNPDYWMNKLRRFFTRLQLRAGEVSIIRGICRQVDWYTEQRGKPRE